MSARLVILPPLAQFSGDKQNKVSPLEQFITYVADLIRVSGGRVWVDPTHIHMNPADAETLFSLLRKFMFETQGPYGANKAVMDWSRLQPREVVGVPRGYAVVNDRCIYIRSDKMVTPALKH